VSDTASDTLTGGAVERRPDPLSDPLPVAQPVSGPLADETPTTQVPATPEALTSAPRADPPPSAAAVPISQRRESITCPECGTVAQVQLTRRESGDFCAKCDFPLFWTPSTIQLGEGATDGATLRRLPGTGGKQTVASTACPHCREANPITNSTCFRCGQPMALAPAPPPPAPVYVAPPPPMPEAKKTPWWVFAIAGVTAALFVALVIWYVLTQA
jgi:ssDNA-binding Zn-finger/Zn-ribbon topoisomerase 1